MYMSLMLFTLQMAFHSCMLSITSTASAILYIKMKKEKGEEKKEENVWSGGAHLRFENPPYVYMHAFSLSHARADAHAHYFPLNVTYPFLSPSSLVYIYLYNPSIEPIRLLLFFKSLSSFNFHLKFLDPSVTVHTVDSFFSLSPSIPL